MLCPRGLKRKDKGQSESRSVISDSFWRHGLYSPWNSPGQNPGVDSLSLLQGIFPIQGSNPGLPHCRRILYQLSHKGSPATSPKPPPPEPCEALPQTKPGFFASPPLYPPSTHTGPGNCNFPAPRQVVIHSLWTTAGVEDQHPVSFQKLRLWRLLAAVVLIRSHFPGDTVCDRTGCQIRWPGLKPARCKMSNVMPVKAICRFSITRNDCFDIKGDYQTVI